MRLLLVEDNDGDARLLREYLAEASPHAVEVQRADRLAAALPLVAGGRFDVALLDLSLPDSHGLGTLTRVHASAPWLPIVVLTSLDNDALGLELIQAGAQDYLVKGQVNGPLLVRSLRYAVERKRTAEALRLSEERYALAVRGSNDGHWDWDLTTNARYHSARWKELLGYKEDDLEDHVDAVFALIHPDDLPHVKAALHAHLTHRVPYNMEFRIRHKNGEYRWFQSRGEALWNEEGRPVRMAGVLTDITDRKRAEAALIESNERYRSLVRTAGIVILVLTPDYKIIEWNREAEQVYGRSRDEVLGEDYFELCMPPSLRNDVAADIAGVLAGEEARGYEHEVTARDGTTRTLSWNVNRIVDATGTPVAVIAAGHDVTERKRSEEALQETLKRVRMLSARLEVIQEEERRRVARELHDELGVGLTCLKIDLSRVRAVLAENAPSVQQRQLIERLDSMLALTDGTIEAIHRIVAKLRPTVLDDLGLVAAIEWQVQDFQERTGVACLLKTPNEDITIEPNRATAVFRICQEALTNIARHADASSVRVRLHERGGELLLEIADNGKGIPAEKVADPRSLGLLGMRERAELFGGVVGVAARQGKGTTVTLRMPVSRSGPQPEEGDGAR